jgi:hypothetical protein
VTETFQDLADRFPGTNGCNDAPTAATMGVFENVHLKPTLHQFDRAEWFYFNRCGPILNYLHASINTPRPAMKSVMNQTLAVSPPTTIVRIFRGLGRCLINVSLETFCQLA